MPARLLDGLVEIRLVVVAYVDPSAPELIEALDDAGQRATAADVVEAEVRSNLESIPYISHVVVNQE